jgi:hypothetical protein
VQRRTEALAAVANEALTAVNAERTRQGQTPAEHVAPASYDAAFHLMFDHPDTDEQPHHEALLTAMQAELHSAAARTSTHPSTGAAHPPTTSTPTVAAAPSTTTAAATSTTAAPTTPPAAPSSATADTPAAAPDATTHPTTDQHPAEHPTEHPTGGRAAAHSPAAATHGEHWAQSEDGQRQWVAERDQTVGQNLSSMGRHLVGDVFHEQFGGLASAFGLDDSVTEEAERQVDRDLHIAQPAAAHGAAAAGAHPAGAHGEHHGDTPPGAHQSAHEAVATISRDPYALDELALRLYPNIRSRLRQELLVDRERAGLLTDFR